MCCVGWGRLGGGRVGLMHSFIGMIVRMKVVLRKTVVGD